MHGVECNGSVFDGIESQEHALGGRDCGGQLWRRQHVERDESRALSENEVESEL